MTRRERVLNTLPVSLGVLVPVCGAVSTVPAVIPLQLVTVPAARILDS